VSQSNEERRDPDLAQAAEFFGEAFERAFARIRDEFREEVSRLQEEIEKLKAERGESAQKYISIKTAVARYGTSRSTVDRMLNDPDLGLCNPEIRIPPITGPRRISVAAFEKAIRMKRPKRRRKPRETEGDE
jgi:hypothetical protein